MKEKEGFGLDYERFAVGQLLKKFVNKYKIKKVLEIPALGVKAMPSLYSLGFGEAGCKVTLVNGDMKSLREWKKVGYKVKSVAVQDITKTPFKDNEFDYVWNFAIFPELGKKDELIREMKRVSKKHVAIFCVNGYNIGSYWHRFLHSLMKVPWTHGDKKFLFYQNTKKSLQKQGMKIKKIGCVDCPPWPDSIGFRDMRLHKLNITFDNADWESSTFSNIRTGKYPTWIKMVYAFENIPMPFQVKLLYSHIYFVLAEKP